MRKKVLYIIIVLLMLGGAWSCRKVTTTLSQGGVITFSTDTLAFDTVFSTQGSYTNIMLIYNPQSEAVNISSVQMAHGSASYFHLNVDGTPGNYVANVKIAPHDSIYVFATVNINPNDSLSPFFITDSLIANMNGKQFFVPFTAFGQNAHFMVGDSLGAGPAVTWLTDKPYVVIHNFIVGPNATLNIPRGCRVYMHQDAQFVVWPSGTLTSGITPVASPDSVVFQGDRLDRAYFGYMGYPGEWCGLWYLAGSTGYISQTVIKNCGNGGNYNVNSPILEQPAAIRVDSNATLHIDHSIVENSISQGILGFNASVFAYDCNVNTTGGWAFAMVAGGNDSIVNCTFANYGTSLVAHADAGTALFLDWYEDPNLFFHFGALTAVVQNTIVYGSLDSEITFDTTGGLPNDSANLLVQNCDLKTGTIREPFAHFIGDTLFNQDPAFKNTANGDFHLAGSESPVWGTGISNGQTPLNESSWQGSGIDIGCY